MKTELVEFTIDNIRKGSDLGSYHKWLKIQRENDWKEQKRIYQKEYRLSKRKNGIDLNHEYLVKNKERIAEYNEKYRKGHTEQTKISNREYYLRNREKISAKFRAYNLKKKWVGPLKGLKEPTKINGGD